MDRKRSTVEVEDEPKRMRWQLRLGVVLAKAVAIVGFSLVVSTGAKAMWSELIGRVDVAKAAVLDKLTVTKVVTEYREVDDATLGETITRVSKERGIDPLVMAVIAEKESSGGRALYRFEAGKFEQLRSGKKYKGRSTDELRMVASSHGVFHTMGYSAENYCGLHWSRLYDTLTAARCTGEILARLHQDTAHIKDPSARVREVFRRYNGEGELAEKYADHAMSLLAGILYKRLARPSN